MKRASMIHVLQRLQAPEPLLHALEHHKGDDVSTWVPTPESRIWFLAAQELPIDPVFSKEMALLLVSIEGVIGEEETKRFQERIYAPSTDHELLEKEISERAEAVTDGYRQSKQQIVLAGYRALGFVSKAFGAVASAHARRAAVIERRAREAGAMVGAGHVGFLGDNDTLRIDVGALKDIPIHSELAYAFACVTEAHLALQRAVEHSNAETAL